MPSGRPSTPLPQRLRAMFWADSVMAACGASSITEMENSLADRRRLGYRIASGLWSRYLRGDATPAGAKKSSNGTLVEEVGRHWPRTQQVFDHPTWQLLQWSPVVDIEKLRRHYLDLGEPIRQNFYRMSGKGQDRDHYESNAFWHLQKAPTEMVTVIKKVSTDPWMTLALALLEARMGFAAQRMDRFYAAQHLAVDTVSRLFGHRSFQNPRIQSALMVMQALCFDPLLANIAQQGWRDAQHEKYQEMCSKDLTLWRAAMNTLYPLWSKGRQLVVRRLLRQIGQEQFNLH